MIIQKLARMAVKVETVRTMTWSQALRMAKEGPGVMTFETACTKLMASEASLENALDATQIFGGYGYTREFPVERYLRDSRLMTIGGGTTEIMLNLLFREAEDRSNKR